MTIQDYFIGYKAGDNIDNEGGVGGNISELIMTMDKMSTEMNGLQRKMRWKSRLRYVAKIPILRKSKYLNRILNTSKSLDSIIASDYLDMVRQTIDSLEDLNGELKVCEQNTQKNIEVLVKGFEGDVNQEVGATQAIYDANKSYTSLTAERKTLTEKLANMTALDPEYTEMKKRYFDIDHALMKQVNVIDLNDKIYEASHRMQLVRQNQVAVLESSRHAIMKSTEFFDYVLKTINTKIHGVDQVYQAVATIANSVVVMGEILGEVQMYFTQHYPLAAAVADIQKDLTPEALLNSGKVTGYAEDRIKKTVTTMDHYQKKYRNLMEK
ncbi:hypothetical protein K9M79_08705 [Candidatus Woesearchaeota archaeon]|nr:hypothetical protein [Candidatus Woesearchaeota archaeon]